ncbi:protein misato homolog 1 isoform X2 [Calypte anna]|uniref:protein misato homolog 1 isoform X2 n=1 Tax=Calypte anna TaxID=9244 RepID=UPI0011C48DD1|nr:protein misato homolog 1 isoform X2 [Calypte anna]
MPGEAVTLQLGQFAGCVGTHWWGLQAAALRSPSEPSELRHTVLLRPGRGPGGREIHTPRLVALELKGGVGAVGAGGAGPEAPVSWDGAVASYLERAPGGGSAAQNAGQRRGDASSDGQEGSSSAVQGSSPAPSRLSVSQDVHSAGSIRVWSDYLNVHLHPKSVYVIRQYMHDGDCGCLEAFGQGESLLRDPGCIEELEDRLHFYVEECDNLQDFQKNFYRLMNTVMGIVHLSSHSSLFCPLSLSGSLGIQPQPPVMFPYLHYDASLNYHSSAILAAALDTLTAPYRLCSSQGSMLHLAETLNFSGRKVVAAWASVPFPALRGSSLPDILCAYEQEVPWKLLSSCREQKVSCCFAQSVVLRGICKESHLSSWQGKQPPSPLHTWESSEQILQQYLHSVFPGAFSTSHMLQQSCHTLPPYPQFFSPLLTREGFLLDKPPRYPSAAVESIPVLAALQSSAVLHTLLHSLDKDLQKLNTRRLPSFFSAGVEHDDFQETLEELRTLSQCYKTGFEADESEDEGDSD